MNGRNRMGMDRNGWRGIRDRVLASTVPSASDRLAILKKSWAHQDEENELQNWNNQINQDEVEQDGYE